MTSSKCSFNSLNFHTSYVLHLVSFVLYLSFPIFIQYKPTRIGNVLIVWVTAILLDITATVVVPFHYMHAKFNGFRQPKV